MTDLEDRLRAELRARAEAAQEGSIRPLRAPNRSRSRPVIRWLAPVMAAAAVIGVIAGVSVISRAPGNQPAAAAPTGMPKYYVALTDVMHGRTPVVTASVRASGTGALLGALPLLRGRPGAVNEVYGVSAWVSAAASDRLFVIGVNESVYALRLAPDGRPGPLRRYPPAIARQIHPFGVLSPDGTQLADVMSRCTTRHCLNGIEVISLTTGARRTWVTWDNPGWTVPLSWTSSDQIFFWHRSRAASGYRLLDATGNGGELLADSTPIASLRDQSGWQLSGMMMLTADGRSVIASDFRNVASGNGNAAARVIELSPRTGRLLRVLHVATAPDNVGFPAGCYAATIAPTGLRALIQCGSFGRLDGSHFTPLPGGLSVTEPPPGSPDHLVVLGQGLPETAAW